MNIQSLYLAIQENREIIKDTNFSISLDKKDLELQIQVLDFLIDGGIVQINFYTPDKSTEQPFAHFCLVKGGLEVNLGCLRFPSIRKPKEKRGMAYLVDSFVKDMLSPKSSVSMSRDNGSMILYVVSKKLNLDEYKLINGYDYRNIKIPEKYDSVEKVLDCLDFLSLEKFRVA